jgi:hypothetical protein
VPIDKLLKIYEKKQEAILKELLVPGFVIEKEFELIESIGGFL